MRRTGTPQVCLLALFLVVLCMGAQRSCAAETILTTQAPAMPNVTDGPGKNYELGMKFVPSVAGQITAIRFWKASKETGTHIGRIWNSSGQVIASVTFGGETASGWQQQALSAPLSVNANSTYVVTVNTGNTFYVDTIGGLSAKISSVHLSSVTNANGVYGPTGRFPTTTYKSSNYFRDVVFTTAASAGLVSNASSLNFANVNVGSSSSQALTFTNKAATAVTISKVTISGSGFSSSGLTVPLTLSSGQQASLKVTFAPTVMGTSTGSVSITSNATTPTLTTGLKGTGLQARISVVPSSVGFGSVPVGVANSQTLTVSNPGNANLVVSQANTSGSGFSVTGLMLPLTVTPGSSSAITVRFAPTSTVAYSGSLSLANNAPGSTLSVPLTGTGVNQTAQLSATPASVNFGNVTQGSTSPQTITLKNSGNSSLSVSKVSSAGTYFTSSNPSLPVTLAPGQTFNFTASFTPGATGTFNGNISVASTATNSSLSIPLTGVGVSPAHKAMLTWTPSTSAVVGYNIYKGTQNGGPYSKINTSTVTGPTYTDASVQSGLTYFYVVTSVTSSGLESVHSSQVSGTIP